MSVKIKEYTVDCGRGIKLRTAECGSGLPIICLHGGASSWHVFERQMRGLAADYRVIAVDLRGHGASPWVDTDSIDDFYNDIINFIEALNLKGGFVLAGHSLGGCLAARYAAQFPARVAGLVLMNTAGHLRDSMASRFFHFFSHSVDTVHHYFPWLVNTNSRMAVCLTETIFRQWHIWDSFAHIKAPTHVILGQFDPLISVHHGLKMASLIPGAQVTLLPIGGHVSLIDCPETVTAIIRKMAEQASRFQPLLQMRTA